MTSAAASRDQRLNANVCVLYHQTGMSAADSILDSGYFRTGSGGMAGAGIYFATSAAHTYHKAQDQDVVLRCRVKLGRVKKISKHGDKSITYAKLLAEGYDSVEIPRDNGTEYVVYNTDQIERVGKEEWKPTYVPAKPVIHQQAYAITTKTMDDLHSGKMSYNDVSDQEIVNSLFG